MFEYIFICRIYHTQMFRGADRQTEREGPIENARKMHHTKMNVVKKPSKTA